MDKKIEEFIIDYFSEKQKIKDYDRHEFVKINFVEDKLLDSIEFITLISEIEENFEIIFTEEDIQSPSFSSINGMVTITSARLRAQQNDFKN